MCSSEEMVPGDSYTNGSGDACDLYGTRQYCDDDYGAWSSIYCIPDC